MTTLSFLRLRWLGGKKVWASVTLATCVWAGDPSYRPVATRASHSIRAPSRPPAATQTGVWKTPTGELLGCLMTRTSLQTRECSGRWPDHPQATWSQQ